MPTLGWILMSDPLAPLVGGEGEVLGVLGGLFRWRSRCSSGRVWRGAAGFGFHGQRDRRRAARRVGACRRNHGLCRPLRCIGGLGDSRSRGRKVLPGVVALLAVHRTRLVGAPAKADLRVTSSTVAMIAPYSHLVWAASFPLHHASHGPPPPTGEELQNGRPHVNSSPVGGGGPTAQRLVEREGLILPTFRQNRARGGN
jgi:hypothetical protein